MAVPNSRCLSERLRLTWIMGCCACVFAILLTGCAEEIPTLEPVTITMADSGGFREYYEALIEEFNERNPHIDVRLIGPRFEAADVFVLPMWDFSYVQRGLDILSLDTFIDQDASFDLSDFNPDTVDILSRDGKVWAIPLGVDFFVLYYNKDLFDQYDVPYPQEGWTWDDFLERALALRDPGASVFGYAPLYASLDSLAFIYQHGASIFDDINAPTRTTFDDPLTIEALDWYAALIHEHNVAPTIEQQTDHAMGRSVKSGVYLNKVGMWLGWFSERGGKGDPWPGPWKMRWGITPLPRDAQFFTLQAVTGFFISSQAIHPEACWQWGVFLSDQIPFGATPARKSLAESDYYEKSVGPDAAAVAQASLANAALPSSQLGDIPFWGIYYQAIEDITRGQETVEDSMIKAQRAAERMNP